MCYKWQMSFLCTDYATYSICPFSAWLCPVWNGHFPKPARANQKPAQFARRLQAHGYSAYIFTIGYLATMYEYGKLRRIKSLKCWTVRIMAMLHIMTVLQKMLICVFSSWMIILWMAFSFLWYSRKLSLLNCFIHINVLKFPYNCNFLVIIMLFGIIGS